MKTITNLMHSLAATIAIGLGGCSDRYHDAQAVARYYSASEDGFPVMTMESFLLQGYDLNNDGEIDQVKYDRFAQLSGRTFVHTDFKVLTQKDGTKFKESKKKLDDILAKNKLRRTLAEKLYGATSLVDSNNDGIVSYPEYIHMQVKASLHNEMVGFQSYVPKKTKDFLDMESKFGDISRLQRIVKAYSN